MTAPHKRIYFGGSFFPPHKAHTEMLRQALSLDKGAVAYIVPTKQNPLKESPGSSLQLIQAWMLDLENDLSREQFSRCILELSELNSKNEKSYTVETLEGLQRDLSKNFSQNQDFIKTDWILLLGSDSALSLDQWKNPQKLISLLSQIWIVPRKNIHDSNFSIKETQKHVLQKLKKLKADSKIKFLKTVSDISSTELRGENDGASSQLLDEYLSPHVREVWKKL
jgi:nicotinate (nicotinamide) nucleotide adenylyltransferase